MDQYKLAVAGINVLDGLKRFNNNATLYERFLYRFIDDKHFAELCTELEAKRVAEAFEAAHALKGVSGNLSMETLHKALLPLVEELRAGNLPADDSLLDSVRQAYETSLAAIKADKEEAGK